jgi:hypothetical protein
MRIVANGRHFRTRHLLVPPLDVDQFTERLLHCLGRNEQEIRRVAATAASFRGELQREPTVDLGDPRAAGWTFLINAKDPAREALIDALAPLALHRGKRDPAEPLLFNGEAPDEWPDWLLSNYSTLGGERPPHYVLIVGGPDQVPFHFQALLDAIASVGRVTFDTVDELRAYVDKLIRLETAAAPVTNRHAIVFATEEGDDDATVFSRRYLAQPLEEHMRARCGCTTTLVAGAQATKARLAAALEEQRPALVYTATHGIGAPDDSLEVQKSINGALCCHPAGGDDLWSAADVPVDRPFLEGSVFFQFACYGYGTPAESDYMHWLGEPQLNAKQNFVAALPKRLLAHPRGPIIYIGHLDLAWLDGFDDPDAPHPVGPRHPRIEPFVFAVTELLRVQPAGLAMANMNARYNIENVRLTNIYDRLQRRRLEWTPEVRRRLGDAFILRSDAQNYLVFGDPAARLRIAAG